MARRLPAAISEGAEAVLPLVAKAIMSEVIIDAPARMIMLPMHLRAKVLRLSRRGIPRFNRPFEDLGDEGFMGSSCLCERLSHAN